MDPFTPFKPKSSRRLVLVNEIGLQVEIHEGFEHFFSKRGLTPPAVHQIIEDEPAFKKWARECLRRDQQFFRVERAIT